MYDDFPNGYIQEELLGQGAEAQVFKYLAPNGCYIAVKKYRNRKSLNNNGTKFFCETTRNNSTKPNYDDEWEIVQKLENNSYLLKYYGIKEIAEQQYLLMEYFPGITLACYFGNYFKQPRDITDEINTLTITLTECLHYLYKNNIYHGDLIKDGNILVNPDTSRAIIIDFGYNVYNGKLDVEALLLFLLKSQIQSLIYKEFIINYNNRIMIGEEVESYLSEKFSKINIYN